MWYFSKHVHPSFIDPQVDICLYIITDTSDVKITNGEVTVSNAGDYYVELVVVGDKFVEGDETFTVEIAMSNPLDTPGPSQTFTVSDDDGTYIWHNNFMT